jgi:hypothetical protein
MALENKNQFNPDNKWLWDAIEKYTEDILNHTKCWMTLKLEFYDFINNEIKGKKNGT